LLGTVLSVCTCWFHSTVTFPPWLVSTDFGTCSYVHTNVFVQLILLFRYKVMFSTEMQLSPLL
jgi:hypothetical protein